CSTFSLLLCSLIAPATLHLSTLSLHDALPIWIVVLDPNKPAPTLTSHPDDYVHYCEPRILSVREYARIQTFPDWFEFKEKYTTRSEEHTSELQSREKLVCRLLLEKKKKQTSRP